MIREFNVQELHGVYRSVAESPFPYIVLDNIWDDQFLGSVRREVEGFSDWAGERRCYDAGGIFNRTVIFATDDHSYRGHPEPLQTPEHVRRNSIATYYYQAEKPKGTAEVKRKATSYADASDRAPTQSFVARLLSKLRCFS